MDHHLIANATSIRLSGPRLGRPKNDPELVASEKQQFLADQRQRNAVEGKIGRGKRRFGLGLIREKLAATQGSAIALAVLVMNLEKLLELLCVLFAFLLKLLIGNEAIQSAEKQRPTISWPQSVDPGLILAFSGAPEVGPRIQSDHHQSTE